MPAFYILFIILVFLLCSCDSSPYFSKNIGCKSCHNIVLDIHHDFSCSKCHKGNEDSEKINLAHKGLISNPSHPAFMMRYCGNCHKNEVVTAKNSAHFTLKNEISMTWQAFFPEDTNVKDIDTLPFSENPDTEKEVLSEVLRKRCLLCHPYYKGEDYSGTKRGAGCASCHLQNRLLEPNNHRFDNKVSDKHCISCHYGNFIGSDYYGRFEKDFEDDYRDIINGKLAPRDYGVEWHALNPDIHKKAGLSCADCHTGGPCGHKNGMETTITCIECHLTGKQVVESDAKLMDESRKGHRVQDINKVSCAACHAVWSFNDYGRNITHSLFPDYYTWIYLMVQGSSEIERYLKSYPDDIQPLMSDKLNGLYSSGLWFMGFYERRWHPVKIGKDNYSSDINKISVLRPLFDMRITYYNRELKKSFVLKPKRDIWSSYSPHTIGKPDFNRVIEIESMLD